MRTSTNFLAVLVAVYCCFLPKTYAADLCDFLGVKALTEILPEKIDQKKTKYDQQEFQKPDRPDKLNIPKLTAVGELLAAAMGPRKFTFESKSGAATEFNSQGTITDYQFMTLSAKDGALGVRLLITNNNPQYDSNLGRVDKHVKLDYYFKPQKFERMLPSDIAKDIVKQIAEDREYALKVWRTQKYIFGD